MVYIPKNRTVNNLYTKGEEYQLVLTGEVYIGSYWKDYQGNFYTGKSPDSPSPLQLEPLSPSDNVYINNNQPKLAYSPTYYDHPEDDIDAFKSSFFYQNIKSIKVEDLTKILPSQSYPKPTENDYKVGNFKRYFCVKTNEDIYLELDKKTHDKLSSKNSNWAHELYTTFQLIWYITGEESQVESTNKNLVLIQEQRSNRKGLKEFLRENYTKFWLPQ